MRIHNSLKTYLFLILTLLIPNFSFSSEIDTAITKAKEYINTQQNPSGSYGYEIDYPNTAIQVTSLVAKVFKEIGMPDEQTQSAIAFLSTQQVSSPWHSALIVDALSKYGIDISLFLGSIIPYIDPNYRSISAYPEISAEGTLLDTVTILIALTSANYSDKQILEKLLSYLLYNQNNNGGFGVADKISCEDETLKQSNILVTSLVLEMLNYYRIKYDIQSYLDKSISFLLSKQNEDGSFGTSIFETALCYYVLAQTGEVEESFINKTKEYILSTQLENGSWDNDPYTTALCVRALHTIYIPPLPYVFEGSLWLSTGHLLKRDAFPYLQFDSKTQPHGVQLGYTNEKDEIGNIKSTHYQMIWDEKWRIVAIYLLEPGKFVAWLETSPGGDHPDESKSIADVPTSLEKALWNTYKQVAIKKGTPLLLEYVKYKDYVNEYLEYMGTLPENVAPDYAYLNKLEFNMWGIYTKLNNQREEFLEELRSIEEEKVAILTQGYYNYNYNLLGRILGKVTNLVFQDFEPVSTLTEFPILIIPSGGLYGLQNSEIFKSNLDKYVKQGGILVVFTQQHGYEFNVLPGTPSGYGWREDQSCQANAAQIDEYHQILTSQKDLSFDGGIDGFFSQWPEGTKILLRRTKNNMPALILYPYGQGYVIATTLYSDYSYAQGSITEDEMNLLRDIITWAKNPKEYVEVKPNQTITDYRLQITNNTTTDANSVKLRILDSNKNVFKEEVISLSVPAGETVTYNYTFTSPTSLGIYSVEYTLLFSGDVVQEQTFADNFAISGHLTSITPDPEISFSVTKQKMLFKIFKNG